MEVLQHLKRQMRVVTNSRHMHRDDYHLCFVGAGRRMQSQRGWWKTTLNYYSLDFVGFSHQLRIDGQEILREKDTVALYAPNVLYEEYYDTPRAFDDTWILFRSKGKADPLAPFLRKRRYCFFNDALHQVPPLIHEASGIGDIDIGVRWRAKAAFLQILALLYQSQSNGNSRALSANSSKGEGLRTRVLRILQDAPRNDFSVDDLARKLGMSRSSFTHRFSRETGETWVEMKNRFRIGRAQLLISSSERPMKEIAYETGFEDPAYFSRIFQNVIGLTPTRYRRLLLRDAVAVLKPFCCIEHP